MDNLEKVEKLRKKADISYEEAKEVLEECGWDLLDAVIELEARGKIKADSSDSYTTESGRKQEAPKSPQQVAESYQNYDNHKKSEKGFFKTIWDGILLLLKKGCENTFIVTKDGRRIMDIPVLLLIVLMIISLCAVLVIMLIALFCGYRYSFAGPDLGREKVNEVMNKAGEAADSIKDEFSGKDTAKNSTENNSTENSTSHKKEEN